MNGKGGEKMSTPKLSRFDAAELYRAILHLKSEEDCRKFFSDLFTKQELATFAQRLQVARMLCEGHTYEKIRECVSASSCTITRVNTELQFGEGGYRLVLERLAQERAATEEKEKE